MNGADNTQFEVRVSRWKIAFVTIAFSAITVSLLVINAQIDRVIGPHSDMVVVISMITIFSVTLAFASLWFRRRPLCVIDKYGITDYGFFLRGFSLINWGNIQGTFETRGRYGAFLIVVVNNYNDLVSRRSPIVRPLYFLAGKLGGPSISLQILWSNTDVKTVRQQIAHYSNNKI